MWMNLANRVAQEQLSPRRYLLPLFEAIANSMHAIEEARLSTNGEITISIIRSRGPRITNDVVPTEPITGFIVQDNGVGFTDDNFRSFKEAYSERKKKKGGKGVGRLLWLKAFRKAEVESTFKENGTLAYRVFDFTIQAEVSSDSLKNVVQGDRRTIVKLIDYLPEYQEYCTPNGDNIAKKIISHFIGSFILGSCPKIILRDDFEGWELDLTHEFKKMQLERRTSTVSIEGHSFRLEHLLLDATSHNQHELHLCAANRAVETEKLSELIPSLRGPLRNGNDKHFFYTVCVYSDFLDERTDTNRTRLDLPDDREIMPGEKEITRQEIWRRISKASDKFLDKYLAPLRDQNTKRIVDYIQQNEPKFRPLAKHRPHWFDRISPKVNDEQLSIELYKLYREYEAETRATLVKVKRKLKNPASYSEHKDRFKDVLTELNDQGIACLADYVVHRRAILDFFAESIEQLPNGKYVAERHIHEIICPLGATSDDVPLDQMNLWLIDERLAFHRYLSSDRQQRSVRGLSTDSQSRADIILFNHACAFMDDNMQSVVIIEFKRPMRNDYTDAENPIRQVYNYVEEIKENRAVTNKGRPITLPPGTPIFAYIICDVTPNLRRLAKDLDFKNTTDGLGYYKFNDGHGVYAEIHSFDKILKDAKQRNAAFFDKLNLPVT
jgi:hypothetical protein